MIYNGHITNISSRDIKLIKKQITFLILDHKIFSISESAFVQFQ